MNTNGRFEKAVLELSRVKSFDEPVYVTRPNLPPLNAYARVLMPAWKRHWLTNDGVLHARLESALAERFDLPCFRLFSSGTMALLTAFQALGCKDGAVITTPFTFPATINTLHWHGLRPMFCDIEPRTCNMDASGIEALITADTRAILPVHVFGTPCDVDAIQAVADRHGLPVIYDAAHAFGVDYKERSILQYGAMSIVSFHATKLFTTGEGGALASRDKELYEKLGTLKNFGIDDEGRVVAPGLNAKMSELHAALGLTQLETVAREIKGRRGVAMRYNDHLKEIPGIAPLALDLAHVKRNYAYYPVRVDRESYGMTSDALYTQLKRFNIHARRYFHPLCSTQSWCRVAPGRLPVAEKAAEEMLCLPLYGVLPLEWVDVICDVIAQLGAIARESA